MENLSEYPVTAEEIVQCLTRMAEEISANNNEHKVVGDVRPLLLLEAATIVERAESQRVADKTFRALEEAYEYLKTQKKTSDTP